MAYIMYKGTKYGGGGGEKQMAAFIEGTLTELVNNAATSVGESAFYYNNKIKAVALPNVVSAGESAFDYCKSLESVDLPKATTIGARTFNSCSSLKTANIPNATTVGYGAFDSCTELAGNIDLPALENLGGYAYNNATKITGFSAPNLVEMEDYGYQFASCSSLADVYIPKVKQLYLYTFYNSGLVSPREDAFESVEMIGNNAFFMCDELEAIRFPTLFSMGIDVFRSCPNLRTFVAPKLITVGDNSLRENKLVTADFPDLKAVGIACFCGCTELTEVNMPEVMELKERAFQDCTKLRTITFTNLPVVGQSAFWNCRSLQSVILPNLFQISLSGFQDCSALEYIRLDKVASIASLAFQGCTHLKAVVIQTPYVCNLASDAAFGYTPIKGDHGNTDVTEGFIYVPASLVDSYKAASGWSTYASKIRAIEDYPDVLNGVIN